MSQNDFNIANQGFPATRADINSALQALASTSAGATAPSTTYAYQLWYDTSTNLLKMRNADNDGFITLAAFDQAADEWELRTAVVQAVDSAGVVIKTDDGTTRVTIADSGNVTLANDLVVTGTVQSSNISATGSMASRNKIFNGAMQVHQRGNQTSVSSNSYSLDRWEVATVGGTAVYDLKQSTDVPTGQGFANSFELDVTTADTAMGSGDGYIFRQAFEGQDLQDLKKGTSNAEQVTVQFWVKSPKAGTHILELFDIDNTRQVSAAYSVATANTWEKFTITFPADTTGAFDNDNARSLILQWWLAAGTDYTSGTLNTSWASATTANRVVGQVNCVDDAANNFYITGVQLEAGDTATPFEHRSYGQELALCQRYFQTYQEPPLRGATGSTTSANRIGMLFPVPMRAAPTVSMSGTLSVYDGSGVGTFTLFDATYALPTSFDADVNLTGAVTSGRPASVFVTGTGGSVLLSSEL